MDSSICVPGHGQRTVLRLPEVVGAGPAKRLCSFAGSATNIMWRIIDDKIKDACRTQSGRRKYLFLERHKSLPLQWSVESFDASYLERMDGAISPYDTVSVFSLDSFFDRAQEEGYEVVFMEDPTAEFTWLRSLSEPVGVSIDSDLDGVTEEGYLPCQAQGINFAKQRRATYLNWSTGVGKAQPLDAKVLTPNGWALMRDMKVGSEIIGSNGRIQEITGVFPRGLLPAFRVTFSDGSSTVSCGEHLWSLHKGSNGSRSLEKRGQRLLVTKTLNEFAADGLFHKSGVGPKSAERGTPTWALPVLCPVEFSQQADPLPIDPYLLGIVLGDGGIAHSTVSVTTADPEIIEEIRGRLPLGCQINKSNSSKYGYHIVKTSGKVNPMMRALRGLDLMGKRSWEKTIPDTYMRSSVENRIALLQGLMDSDGTPSASGGSFTSTSRVMAEQVVELARSLGGLATGPKERITSFTYKGEEKNGRPSFRTSVNGIYPMFKLDRKLDKQTPHRNRYRNLVSIEPIEPTEMQCISVSAPDHLYITDDFIPTHNSVAMLGLIEWYIEQGLIDLVLCFVKTNNKVNTQRGIDRLWDIKSVPDSVIVDGTLSKREKQYVEVARSMVSGDVPILITNHEKVRDDVEAMKFLLHDRRVLILWDEMSSKFGNHETAIYKGATEALYTSHTTRTKTVKRGGKSVSEKTYFYYPEFGSERTKEAYHVALSATPIEHNPGQFFNQFRLMDPTIYGSRRNFEHQFSKGRDPWGNLIWNNDKLPLMGLMAIDAIHQIDKEDPDIAAQFPEVMPPETVYLTMGSGEARLYDKLVAEYESMRGADASILDETEILAALNVLELVCCNPVAVLESAKAYDEWLTSGGDPNERRGSQVAWKLRELVDNDKKFDVVPTKAQALVDIVKEDSTEKFVVFTTLNDQLIPFLSKLFDEEKISHVVYHGGLSMKQKQAAEDAFQNDPDVQVFLSSDAGSDSINLHAAAEVIHYNDPWSYAKKIQRQNRINRVVSKRSVNRYRTLRFAGTYEDRKEEVIRQKEGFHNSILRGDIAEQAQQLRRGDFAYVLLGG